MAESTPSAQGESPNTPAEAKKPRRRKTAFILSLLLFLGAAGGLTGLVWTSPNGPDTLTDMAGSQVVPDDGSVPTGKELAAMDVQATDMSLRVPAVGLDVPLEEMSEVGGVIRPPGFQSAYLIRNRGVSLDDTDKGTVYVAVHSLRGGKGPGNYLIDVEAGTATVKVGDRIEVGSRTYSIDETRSVPKSQLPNETDLWEDTPNRLVLITCLQRTAGRSLNNMVIVATLLS